MFYLHTHTHTHIHTHTHTRAHTHIYTHTHEHTRTHTHTHAYIHVNTIYHQYHFNLYANLLFSTTNPSRVSLDLPEDTRVLETPPTETRRTQAPTDQVYGFDHVPSSQSVQLRYVGPYRVRIANRIEINCRPYTLRRPLVGFRGRTEGRPSTGTVV